MLASAGVEVVVYAVIAVVAFVAGVLVGRKNPKAVNLAVKNADKAEATVVSTVKKV